jgi:hypothetical protein
MVLKRTFLAISEPFREVRLTKSTWYFFGELARRGAEIVYMGVMG